jgi:cytochrome P450
MARDRDPCIDPKIFAINAAHRDPAVYDRPDEFDITRNVMPTVSFGQGPHSCVGNWLANTELVAALRLLVRRLPDLAWTPRRPIRQRSQAKPIPRCADPMLCTSRSRPDEVAGSYAGPSSRWPLASDTMSTLSIG